MPLPIDPVTGKPFDYAVEGATAHIRGSSLPGEEQPGATSTTSPLRSDDLLTNVILFA